MAHNGIEKHVLTEISKIMAIKVKERTERYNISVYPETELSIELLWQKENLFKRLLKQINYVGLLCGFENKDGEWCWLIANDEIHMGNEYGIFREYENKNARLHSFTMNPSTIVNLKQICFAAYYNRFEYDDSWERTKAELHIKTSNNESIVIPFGDNYEERSCCFVCSFEIGENNIITVNPKMEFAENMFDLVTKYGWKELECNDHETYEH